MVKKKIFIILIISALIFLMGCMGGSSAVDVNPVVKQPTEKVKYTDFSGIISLADDSLSRLAIEVYLFSKTPVAETTESTDESDTNISRSPSLTDYDYKALTDVDGKYYFENIEQGTYDIYAVKNNYSYKLVENFLIDDSNTSLDIDLGNPGTISGRVVYKDGTSKYGIAVYVDGKSVLTDSQGNFEMSVPEGTFEILIDEFGYERFTRDVSVESDVKTELGDLILEKNFINPDLAVFRSKVVTSFGVPLTNAHITLYSSDNIYKEISDSKGEFTIYNIVPGSYILKIVNEYYGTMSSIELTAGQLMEIDNVVIDNLYKYGVINLALEGEVIDPELLDIKIVDKSDNDVNFIRENHDAVITLLGISYGDYTIKVDGQTIEAKDFDVSIVNGMNNDITSEFTLKKGSISGFVKDSSGDPVLCKVFLGETSVNTTDTGMFTFGDLEEGTYTITINAFGFDELFTEVEVGSGEDIDNLVLTLTSKETDGIEYTNEIPAKVKKAVEYDSVVYMLTDDRKSIYTMNKDTSDTELIVNTTDFIDDFVFMDDHLYTVDGYYNTITKYNLDGTLIMESDIGLEPFRIESGLDTLLVLSRGDNKLYLVNPEDLTKDAYSTGFAPSDMAVKDTIVYVSDRLGNKINLFDTVLGSFTSNITGITRPQNLYMNSDILYVRSEYSSEISRIDTSTLTKLSSINTGLTPEDIHFGADRLYVVSGSKVAVFDIATATLDKLMEIAPDLGVILEDKERSERLFIFKKYDKKVIVYFCK